MFSFGDFRLEPDGTLLRGEETIHLPPKELAALRLLLHHAGRVVTFTEFKAALWSDVHVTDESIPRCISSLRARLGFEDCIRAVYKHGYRLAIPVRRVECAPRAALPRLAIVPFSPGPNVPEHLAAAVAGETASRLTVLHPPLVSVLARDSVFSLAARGMSAVEVGGALHADLVLTGVLHALPSRLRLRVEMIRVSDATQIWVEDMLVPHGHLAGLNAELVDRLAYRIAGELAISAAAEADSAFNAQSYELFLRGRYEWQSLERHGMQDGIQHLNRAIEMEPGLIPARVDLAHACLVQEMYGFMSPAVAADHVRRIAASMPLNAPNSDELLPALGWVAFHVDHDLPSALRLFSRADGLTPDSWRTRIRALFASSRHRFDEASELIEGALRLDPYAPWMNGVLAWTLHLAGRAEESVRQIDNCLEIFPAHAATRLYGGMILAFNGYARRATELTRELARSTPSFDLAMAIHAYALACDGCRDEAQELLEQLQWLSRERFVMRAFTPAAHIVLGDYDAAIAELRIAEETRCPWFFQMLADPRLAPLQGHGEFARMRGVLQDIERTAAGFLADAAEEPFMAAN